MPSGNPAPRYGQPDMPEPKVQGTAGFYHAIDLKAEGDSTLTTVGGTAPILRQGTLEGETHPYHDSSCAWTRARPSRSP
jgi:hypothetical protein